MLQAAVCLALAGPAAQAAAPVKKAPPPPVEAVVLRVVDGDTFWVSTADGAAPRPVRIEGIDAPESCQPGGPQATAALSDLVLRQTVTLHTRAMDEHGRLIARVQVGAAAVDVGDRLVRDGHAWSTRWRSDRGPYVAQERMAVALRRGLHAAGEPELPRDFRRRHGACEPAGAASAPK